LKTTTVFDCSSVIQQIEQQHNLQAVLAQQNNLFNGNATKKRQEPKVNIYFLELTFAM